MEGGFDCCLLYAYFGLYNLNTFKNVFKLYNMNGVVSNFGMVREKRVW